jgi:hypothetical protein
VVDVTHAAYGSAEAVACRGDSASCGLTRDELMEVRSKELQESARVLGADLIENVHSLHMLIPLVRHHHEWYNGQGYPDRLRSNAIPLEARILSVADAVEAMASDRPYRLGMDGAAILAEIQAQAGPQFDPTVVAALCRVMQREGASVIVNSAREIAAPASAAETQTLYSLGVNLAVSRPAYAAASI